MEAYKKIWWLIPLVLLVSYALLPLIGNAGAENWYLQNRTMLVLLMAFYLFISGIGYWVNRKKEFSARLLKWHFWMTFLGLLIILSSIVGYYYYDVRILENSFALDYFKKEKTNFIALVFIASGLLVVGLFCYIINLIISNYSSDKTE